MSVSISFNAFLHTACQKIGSCMILSSWSTVSLEDVASANENGLRWMHMSFMNSLDTTKQLIRRIEGAGYKALVVTLDTPVRYRKIADIRNGFSLPSHLSLSNFKSDSLLPSDGEQAVASLVSAKLSWESIDWLRSVTSLPIVLKGILRPDDAREALKHDIQGILVSNHGGRKLDTVPASVISILFSRLKRMITIVCFVD